uniref:UNC93-like protein n=1 Tax=Anopheles melas TaxID=34690 RepID=A0A182UG67_9DIPT
MHGGGVDTDKQNGGDTASLREKVQLRRGEKWRILKNIITVSVAFMVQFTAFQGTANLQSSINAKDGLGTVSLSVVYAALVVSCIFLPTLVIRKLTVKWTLCVSMLCYAPYIASQFYPRFYTLLPAGVLLGLGAAPMWASKATYLTQLGQVYAKLTDQSVEAIIVRFFGFFFLAWQTAELWGNLISSLVLSSGAHGVAPVVDELGNGTGGSHHDDSNLESCGANFCVVETSNNANLQRPPDSEIFEISAIYLSCIVAAVVIIAVFLDPLSRYGERRRGSISATEISGMQLLSATFKQLKKANQQLLIPITVFIGMQQAFIGADFTQAYVSCALGIHQIGYVMICFGVVNAICSIIFGSAMKYIGRVVIIILGLYGALFRRNKEAAFSNYRLWESVGFVVAYAYSTNLCARMKLYLLFGVLVCGMVGYTIVEIRQLKKEKHLKKLEEIPKQQQTEADRKVIEEDDEKDELEEDIVVTHL